MKKLITDQLIEEYQKESDKLKTEISIGKRKHDVSHLITEKISVDSFISRLQSLRQEEEQNIKDAHKAATLLYSGQYTDAQFVSENYLTSTFQQQPK